MWMVCKMGFQLFPRWMERTNQSGGVKTQLHCHWCILASLHFVTSLWWYAGWQGVNFEKCYAPVHNMTNTHCTLILLSPGINVRLHVRLQWQPLIGPHTPAVYASKLFCSHRLKVNAFSVPTLLEIRRRKTKPNPVLCLSSCWSMRLQLST